VTTKLFRSDLLPFPPCDELPWLCGGLGFFAALGLAAAINGKASQEALCEFLNFFLLTLPVAA
jgi:hypothetical protein